MHGAERSHARTLAAALSLPARRTRSEPMRPQRRRVAGAEGVPAAVPAPVSTTPQALVPLPER
jgi:hypothetical protein